MRTGALEQDAMESAGRERDAMKLPVPQAQIILYDVVIAEERIGCMR
jgi:hypothetical protein